MARNRIKIADNLEIWSETFGSNKGNAVILIAGAMAPATFWVDDFCGRLAENSFVIRFDNRDFGYSTHFEESETPPYRMEDMVEDVSSVLGYYDIGQAHVIGHSLGASVAQLFAAAYPQRVKTLIPISSPVIAKGGLPYRATPPEVLDEMWNVLLSNKMYPDYDRGKDEFLRVFSFLNGDYEIDRDMACGYIERIYRTEIIKPHANHINIQKNVPDIYEKLYHLSKPILFIYGSRDLLAANPENTAILADSLPTAELMIVDGAGHMFFNREIWNILFDRIIDFIMKK